MSAAGRIAAGLLCAGAAAGCWPERVTGTPVPLDPRFYAAAEAKQGQPGEGGGGSPFSTATGPKVTVSGRLDSPVDAPIDLDVRVPDPKAPGGMAARGKLLIERPGPWSFEAPVGVGAIEIEAFQDETGDGPSADDPYARLTLTVADAPVPDLLLVLVPGARGTGPGPGAAPPGAPGGGGAPGTPPPPGTPGTPPPPGVGTPSEPPPGVPGEAPPPGTPPAPGAGLLADPWATHTGPKVTLRGSLESASTAPVDVDVFVADPEAPRGRRLAAKKRLPPGAFTLQVPVGLGRLEIEAFQDLTENGPGPGDPMGRYDGRLVVDDEDIDGIDIRLAITKDGRMPMPKGRPGSQGGERPPAGSPPP